MMKIRLNDDKLDEYMKYAIDEASGGTNGIGPLNYSNLVIVELLNRLLEKN